jgi:hypothetical protein
MGMMYASSMISQMARLAQEIDASPIFPITEIVIIKNHKLDDTFLHVAFVSHGQLRTMSDLTCSDTNWRIEEATRGGLNGSLIKFFHMNPAYVPH